MILEGLVWNAYQLILPIPHKSSLLAWWEQLDISLKHSILVKRNLEALDASSVPVNVIGLATLF